MGWVAVFVISILMYFTEWWILDPILSIAFTLFILFNVSKHVWATLKLFVQASPDEVLQQQIIEKLNEMPEVIGFHHLHLWSLDGEKHVFTAHLTASFKSASDYANLKEDVHKKLAPFELAHTTIEIEQADEDCRDA
ncbi:MAG: cobalt-zinc-cadmium efflux system protein [Idiomarinaceae bacterium HL-53]|nr:MAG: cobalt-zinc-cadmium efflux system protein [Idiomarinaceae bacterium HL-53]